MRVWKSSMLSKTRARPRCCMRCGEAAAGLMMAPAGARLPRSTAMPPSVSRGWCRTRITSASQMGAASK
jgi:hypothetical protein